MFELDHIIPPPTSFYFNVHFIGPVPILDMSFLEVSGLTLELETEEIDVGGGIKRKIPIRQKHGDLICKRPMKPIALSTLSGWTALSMQGGVDMQIVTSDIIVSLLSPIGTPECVWYLSGAYPVKWDVAGFDSKKNEVAIETIEFAYNSLTRVM